MKIEALRLSENVIDLTKMVYMTAQEYTNLVQSQRISGVIVGMAMGVAVSITSIALYILYVNIKKERKAKYYANRSIQGKCVTCIQEQLLCRTRISSVGGAVYT
jgi:phage terminase large subunit